MAAFSGFYESHKPLPLGDARGIIPPHRDGQPPLSLADEPEFEEASIKTLISTLIYGIY
jgi:hypothetical protein